MNELLPRDAFVCPACGGLYPLFQFAETVENDDTLDASVMAWTPDGEPAEVTEGFGWDVRVRSLKAEEIAASRDANDGDILYCGACDHYFAEPAPADAS